MLTLASTCSRASSLNRAVLYFIANSTSYLNVFEADFWPALISRIESIGGGEWEVGVGGEP